jgi:small subunit ribosomal protein S1
MDRSYNLSIIFSEISHSMEHNDETIGMNEAETHPMDALLNGEAYDLETPRRGEIRTGTIARVTETDILVDIGAKSEGIIASREIEELTDEQREDLTVGKDVNVYVIRTGGQDGTILLSLSRAEEESDWREAEELLESKGVFEGEIAGFNKGGLIIKMGHLRGFIPASQVSLSRRRRAEGDTPDKRWGEMVGESILTRVIEVDRRRNRLILSERAASREMRESMKEKLIEELNAGDVRTGHVISLADFGAFIDIGGADGLVHLSEISWKRIGHPKEALRVGQEVQVKVLDVDAERKRISLSIRELESDPWNEFAGEFKEGQLVEGTITKLTKFGAFASIDGIEDFDMEGLIHISELSDRHIEHPREVVSEGDALTMRIIRIEQDRKRIGLSLKKVDSSEYADMDWKAALEDFQAEDEDQEEAEQPLPSEAEAVEPDAPETEAEETVQVEAEAEAKDAVEADPEVEEIVEAEVEAEVEGEGATAEVVESPADEIADDEPSASVEDENDE